MMQERALPTHPLLPRTRTRTRTHTRSTHYYKELEVNALGTTWNLLMVKPYIDGGPPVCNGTEPGQCHESDADAGVVETWDITSGLKVGVDVNGTLNDPAKGSTGWTVELCLPLADYVKFEDGANMPPREGDYWRINFSRVQYRVKVETLPDGTQVYRKDEAAPPDNWVFSPIGVVNMYVPARPPRPPPPPRRRRHRPRRRR